MKSYLWLTIPIALGLAQFTTARDPEITPEPQPITKTDQPWFVDDEKVFADFMDKLRELAKNGKCLANDQLVDKLKSGTKANITLTKPGNKVLTPEEIYRDALPSVFMIGSVHKKKEKDKEKKKDNEKGKEKQKEGDWQDGMYATAWVAAENGILVTNWHVFEDLEDGEVFGAVDYKGNVYPVIDFLGGEKIADVAIVKIDAKGLKPLPLADSYAGIGSWAAVLGHPGDNYFVFTQGFVTRYSTNTNDQGRRERWMGLTADYAGGSSGSPVLNKYGAVVGMAALTITIDGTPGAAVPDRRRSLRGQPPMNMIVPPVEKPVLKDPPKPEQMPGAGSSVQMILKLAVPGPTILKSFTK